MPTCVKLRSRNPCRSSRASTTWMPCECWRSSGFASPGKAGHLVLTDGQRILTIPRHNPVNAFTMGGIVRDAGVTVERFRELL